jgi:hypothetical protein
LYAFAGRIQFFYNLLHWGLWIWAFVLVSHCECSHSGSRHPLFALHIGGQYSVPWHRNIWSAADNQPNEYANYEFDSICKPDAEPDNESNADTHSNGQSDANHKPVSVTNTYPGSIANGEPDADTIFKLDAVHKPYTDTYTIFFVESDTVPGPLHAR